MCTSVCGGLRCISTHACTCEPVSLFCQHVCRCIFPRLPMVLYSVCMCERVHACVQVELDAKAKAVQGEKSSKRSQLKNLSGGEGSYATVTTPYM